MCPNFQYFGQHIEIFLEKNIVYLYIWLYWIQIRILLCIRIRLWLWLRICRP
jgi:hypothetical protein